jgi:hypothetical protein
MNLSEEMALDPVPGAAIFNHRATRFAGEDQTCQLHELSATCLPGLRWLYEWLASVGEYASQDLCQPSVSQALGELLRPSQLERVIGASHDITPVALDSVRMARVVHDLRGTALYQLIGLTSLWSAGVPVARGLQAIAILAGDHAKFMRHAVLGLDEPRRLTDSGRRLHGVENLRRRFPFLLLVKNREEMRVDFAALWDGDFALTCPEFSTVLKQLYNLLNNATRHAADRVVYMRVYPTPAEAPRAVRLVVANALTSEDRAALSPAVLAQLWRGYTSTGSGLGLIASASLVSEAFGLNGPAQAVDLGYVGSRVTDNGYIAWLHWPVT